MNESKQDVLAQLKALRLHGMAGAWAELAEQGHGLGIQTSRWLVEHLLQAEDVDRGMRSIAHQMKSARFPVHGDLAGFDFAASQVDEALVGKLADLTFTEDAQNVEQSRKTAKAELPVDDPSEAIRPYAGGRSFALATCMKQIKRERKK